MMEKELIEKIEESIQASRLTNALLLASALHLDLTLPLDAQKVLRRLEAVEGYVGGEVHD